MPDMERLINNYRILSFAQAQAEAKSDTECFNIGPTPYNEDCTPAGINHSDSIFECAVYVRQLIRTYGDPPQGCEFFIMRNEHDYGTYYDANIFFKMTKEDDGIITAQSEKYAFKVENGLAYWDDQSKQELINGEHHLHTCKVIDIKKSA